ncbi:PrsW family glutamic-type intramembrane protease [Corynebacterium cystitidis]|uniref:PrsW family glutamic-type intramembrane protease n=1 Tax=Corynebacterium cystitidis TaxID=35757 RepID=UPI00211E5E74|nr:PrsW family glutamic-type intramembrane protease [Corynebacterium cystitidis]
MSKAFHVTLIVGILLGLPLAVLSFTGMAASSPIGAVVGTAIAVVFLLVSLFVLRLLPQWPRPVNPWAIVSALLWGSCAVMVAATVAGLPWFDLTNAMGWPQADDAFGGAYPEEIGKALGVFLILMSFPA